MHTCKPINPWLLEGAIREAVEFSGAHEPANLYVQWKPHRDTVSSKVETEDTIRGTFMSNTHTYTQRHMCTYNKHTSLVCTMINSIVMSIVAKICWMNCVSF